jgi:hypothetical protein
MRGRGLKTVGDLARGLLDLFHYSDEVRPVIDPAQQLTNPNIRGMERELSYPTRMTKYGEKPEVLYDPYPPQSYFGTQNYIPETGLGDAIMTTRQPEEGFYDVSIDLEKLYMLATEEVDDLIASFGKTFSPQERRQMITARAMGLAKDANFLGLSNKKYRPEVYTMFDKVVPEMVQEPQGQMMSLQDYLRKKE